MAYSSTNPRPLSEWQARAEENLDSLQRESSHEPGHIRVCTWSPSKPFRFSYSSNDRVRVSVLRVNSRGRAYTESLDLTTSEVLSNPFVLPYYLPTVDIVTEESKKSPIPSNLLALYRELQSASRDPKSRKLYILTRYHIIDDLGRLYYRSLDKSGRYVLSLYRRRGGTTTPVFGDGRHEIQITIDSVTLSLAQYVWNSLAGFSSSVQASVVSSKGIDVHHVQENLCDMRPSMLWPIPTFLHREIHSVPRSYEELLAFFSHN